MGLLEDIQIALLNGADIGPILLKLRFLSSSLGSELLEDWVKYEIEGYPSDVEVPSYRRLPVNYTADFSGPFGSGIKNAPIPPYLISKHAGDKWVTHEERQSLPAIETLIAVSTDSAVLHTDASNLILILQGKIYEGYGCVSVTGVVSRALLVAIQATVRARVLDLTIQLEKAVPAARQIRVGYHEDTGPKEIEKVTSITNQVINGNVTHTTISSSGAGTQITVNVAQRDEEALRGALTEAGIAEADAAEFASLVASEEPESSAEPFGQKTKTWITQNLGKAASGVWKIGISVATDVLAKAAAQYYGLS